MKLHVLSEHLQKKLPFISKITSIKTQLPVLQNMLLQGENGKLIISATDLEIGLQIKIAANIEETGEVTVPARQLAELINSLPREKLTIQTNDSLNNETSSTLSVISKKTKSNFQTIVADEFPKLYEEKGEEVLIIKQQELQKIISRVLFSASIDTSRPALSGVYISSSFFVATDGYRLSLVKNTINLKITKPLLISARVFREMTVLKNEEDSDIHMFIIEKTNQVLFQQEDTLLVGRLIEAQFPDYEKIIPNEATTKVVFETGEMEKAVKMASIFARESANIVRFSIKKESIIVTANAPQTGENTIEVEAKLIGEENEIAFNARYLLDLFANVKEEEMILEMTTPTSPGVFKVKGDPTFLHLIMPIRIQSET